MITFILASVIMLITIVIGCIICFGVTGFGAIILTVFGDVIVFGFIIYLIVRRILKKKE